jgi:hypothetical protein
MQGDDHSHTRTYMPHTLQHSGSSCCTLQSMTCCTWIQIHPLLEVPALRAPSHQLLLAQLPRHDVLGPHGCMALHGWQLAVLSLTQAGVF